MQRFLNGDTVIPDSINYKHFISSKNDRFNNFCSWYESTNHEIVVFLSAKAYLSQQEGGLFDIEGVFDQTS